MQEGTPGKDALMGKIEKRTSPEMDNEEKGNKREHTVMLTQQGKIICSLYKSKALNNFILLNRLSSKHQF